MRLPPFGKKLLGFTLVELLIVVSIIAILAGLVFAAFTRAQVNARDARRVNDLNQVKTALELYFEENSVYPWSNAGNLACNSSRTLAWGSPFECTLVFMRILPLDPLPAPHLQYCYISVEDFGVDRSTFYTLYASMENDNNGNISPPELCGGAGGSPYNYKLEVTK